MELVYRIFRRDGNQCFWCKRSLHYGDATIDHLVPLGRGGKDRFGNMVASCYGCNHARADSMPVMVSFDSLEAAGIFTAFESGTLHLRRKDADAALCGADANIGAMRSNRTSGLICAECMDRTSKASE